MRLDLHLHSCFSHDATNSPHSIVRWAQRRGLDGVALTDHGTTDGWNAVRSAVEEAGLLFIPGQEVRVTWQGEPIGDVVCLFLRAPVAGTELDAVVEQVRDQDALAAVAHPFAYRRWAFKNLKLLEYFPDLLIETRNGRTYSREGNERAEALARRLGRAVTAGSDAHVPWEIGSVWVEVKAANLPETRRLLREGRATVRGHPASPVHILYSGILGRLGVKL
ncbi:MAG: PHP domain-containing protein [Calditrichaeota bacterium]|nr:PHP domain-containing protein [Calditrichota bacterium]